MAPKCSAQEAVEMGRKEATTKKNTRITPNKNKKKEEKSVHTRTEAATPIAFSFFVWFYDFLKRKKKKSIAEPRPLTRVWVFLCVRYFSFLPSRPFFFTREGSLRSTPKRELEREKRIFRLYRNIAHSQITLCNFGPLQSAISATQQTAHQWCKQ